MNLLLIAHSGAFFISNITNNKENNFILKSFLLSLIFILFNTLGNNFISVRLFYHYEIFLIALLIINYHINNHIFTSIFFAIALITTTDLIPLYITNINMLTVLTILLVFLILLLRKAKKHIRNYLLTYFLSTYLLQLLPITNELFLMVMFIKMVIVVVFLQYVIQEYNKDIKKDREKLNNLEENFENKVKMEAKRRTISLERLNEKALKKAKTDKLTSTLNKDGILGKIEEFIHDKRIKSFSLLFFDIDDFKGINDNYGHNVGDKALRSLAINVNSLKRDADHFGRYGGDEFIILLKDATTAQALMVADRYRKKISNNSSPKFTISIGISTYPNDGRSVDELLKVADLGLYATKEKGKNGFAYKGVNTVY
jgi:diguanylate cyclase (GGDEF)-like protein